MSDPFIEGLIVRVGACEERARNNFGSLDAARLNWKPDATRWSVAQCLEHLLMTNRPYFPIFQEIVNGTNRPRFLERIPLWPALCGRLIYNSVGPDSPRTMRALKSYSPEASDVSPDIVNAFCAHQRDLISAFRTLDGIDFDKTIITSPQLSFITYSLRQGCLIVVGHEERHLNQADQVLADCH